MDDVGGSGRARSPRGPVRWIAALAVVGVVVFALTFAGGEEEPVDDAAVATTAPSTTSTSAAAADEVSTTTTVPPTTASASTGAASPTTAAPTTTAPAPAGTVTVDELVAMLEVAPEGSGTGYDRDRFAHWVDDDGDGCDTRREVLVRDSLTPVSVGRGCDLSGGSWRSAYDGYSTPDPSELHVDHVVALAEAWRSGADRWDDATRRAFANDLTPGALVAVTEAMNVIKSDRDPASWQPPNRDAWCWFTSAWVGTKVRWGLTADPAEVSAVTNMLRGCPPVPMPERAVVRQGPPPTEAPAGPTDPPAAGCDPSYPDVCIPPPPPDLDCGEIEHRRFRVVGADPHRFDGNDDGVGCEG